MATRHLEAIDHKGKVYVSLEDLQVYLTSLVDRVGGITGRDTLHHVLYQLATVKDQRPV